MATKKKVEKVPPKIIYKLLGKEFDGRASQKTFYFTLVKREGDVAIYKKTDKEVNISYFEAVIIRKHNGRTMGNVFIPPAEIYPSDNEFGIYGWCCTTLEKAEIRFQEFKQKLAC